MTREKAVSIIINDIIEKMTNESRYEVLLDWWGIDQEDTVFNELSDVLQYELVQLDEPPDYVMDDKYNPLIFRALKYKYLGVKNEYLSKRVCEILGTEHDIEGIQEELSICPCCEYKSLLSNGEYDICPVCFWEDDGTINPEEYSSPNHMTLDEGRKHFTEFGAMSLSSLEFIKHDRLEKYSKS
ncbi:CPCC family cysteine-rich protein [Paenibacillus sp. YIM B09110]|uniref:CPCC family cysteine-rich protein n=1 Tax=Paenibacillus sp. YIM B09110 TaxID=3126102 RepID=UPI00301E6208